MTKSGRKAIKKDRLKELINELRRNQIKVQAFYIIGLIDDTEKSIQNTIRYSQKLNTFTAQYCTLTPFPGTKTFDDLKNYLITEDFSSFTEYNPVVSLKYIKPERIKFYLKKAYNSYYLRPRWIYRYGITAIRNLLSI